MNTYECTILMQNTGSKYSTLVQSRSLIDASRIVLKQCSNLIRAGGVLCSVQLLDVSSNVKTL